MNSYYAFISGLPELRFGEEKVSLSSEDYLIRLREFLPANELEAVLWLSFRKYHPGIMFFISGQGGRGQLPPGFPAEIFDPEHESFNQLPEYLKSTVKWIYDKKGKAELLETGQKLNEFYFRQLQNAESRFLRKWGESEQNLLNFLAGMRFSSRQEEKKGNLISGNQYYQILMQYPFDAKIISTEFPGAQALEQISRSDNYLERERTIDRFRWEQIDRINRFQYFTFDVIMGYFQKLLISERWYRIFHTETATAPEFLAEKIRKNGLTGLEN